MSIAMPLLLDEKSEKFEILSTKSETIPKFKFSNVQNARSGLLALADMCPSIIGWTCAFALKIWVVWRGWRYVTACQRCGKKIFDFLFFLRECPRI